MTNSPTNPAGDLVTASVLDQHQAIYDQWLANALAMHPDRQFEAATKLAANVGYELVADAPHPDATGPGAFEAAAERAFARSGGDTATVLPEDYLAASPAHATGAAMRENADDKLVERFRGRIADADADIADALLDAEATGEPVDPDDWHVEVPVNWLREAVARLSALSAPAQDGEEAEYAEGRRRHWQEEATRQHNRAEAAEQRVIVLERWLEEERDRADDATEAWAQAKRAALSSPAPEGEAAQGQHATIVGVHTIQALLRGEDVQHGLLLLMPASDISNTAYTLSPESAASCEESNIVMVACGKCGGIGCGFCDDFGHFNRPVRDDVDDGDERRRNLVRRGADGETLRLAREVIARAPFAGGDVQLQAAIQCAILDGMAWVATAALAEAEAAQGVEPTEAEIDRWAHAFANWRQGQSSTPRCEAPGKRDVQIARELVVGVLAARRSMDAYPARGSAAALSSPAPEGEAEPDWRETERNDYVTDAQARELFGTEDDEALPEGRVRVCDGEWVRIPGGYYFDKSAGPLHPEVASEACDRCTVTIAPEGEAARNVEPLTRAEALDALAADYGERMHEGEAAQPEIIGTTYDGVNVLAPAVPSSRITRDEARKAVQSAREPEGEAAQGVEPVALAIREFAQAILHGDDEHRGWLEEAAECFVNGQPLPEPRGKGTQSAPPSVKQEEAVPVIRLDGIDEYGPRLGWYVSWTSFAIGTEFCVMPSREVRR